MSWHTRREWYNITNANLTPPMAGVDAGALADGSADSGRGGLPVRLRPAENPLLSERAYLWEFRHTGPR